MTSKPFSRGGNSEWQIDADAAFAEEDWTAREIEEERERLS